MNVEPIRLWRFVGHYTPSSWAEGLPAYGNPVEYAALTRAEHDALAAAAAQTRTLRTERDSLVAERDEERRIAGYYRDVCAVTGHDNILDRAADAVQDVWEAIRRHERPDDVYPEDTVDRLAYERDAATARAERAEAAYSALCEERDKWERLATDLGVERRAAVRDRDDAHRASMTAAEDFANATGRVCQSNLELRALLKLAKDAMENVISGIKAGATPAILLGVASMCRHVATRIDALLDTPTDDDTRGDGRDEGGKQNA